MSSFIIIFLSSMLLITMSYLHIGLNHILLNKKSFKNQLLFSNNRWEPPSNNPKIENIEINNGITYTVELPKSSGISWGSDISFRCIYVQDLDPQGEAAKTGMVNKGIVTYQLLFYD